MPMHEHLLKIGSIYNVPLDWILGQQYQLWGREVEDPELLMLKDWIDFTDEEQGYIKAGMRMAQVSKMLREERTQYNANRMGEETPSRKTPAESERH